MGKDNNNTHRHKRRSAGLPLRFVIGSASVSERWRDPTEGNDEVAGVVLHQAEQAALLIAACVWCLCSCVSVCVLSSFSTSFPPSFGAFMRAARLFETRTRQRNASSH